jgi:anti-sigma factor RsiW
MGQVIGHVGSRVGALVDGQLPAEESERLWAHVHGCRRCRASVEREGWVKMQLAGLASSWPASAPLGLRQGLVPPAPQAPVPHAPSAAASPNRPSTDHRGLVTVAVLGAGSIGAAMVGVIALSVTATGPDPARRVTTSFETTSISTLPARSRTTEP